jgi:hypothetical protein
MKKLLLLTFEATSIKNMKKLFVFAFASYALVACNNSAAPAEVESQESTGSANSTSFETAEILLQAIADEINDGKLENWSRFYVSGSDLEQAEIGPLVKEMSNFHGKSEDKATLARHLMQMAENDRQNIIRRFVVDTSTGSVDLYANSFKTIGFQKFRAKKWLSHSGDLEYLYMFDARVVIQCPECPIGHEGYIDTDIVKTPSGWKAASQISLHLR